MTCVAPPYADVEAVRRRLTSTRSIAGRRHGIEMDVRTGVGFRARGSGRRPRPRRRSCAGVVGGRGAVAARLDRAEPLAGTKKEPGWRAFLRQYEDFMQSVLLGGGGVNQIVTGETGTTVVLAGLTVFNAVVGLRQESKAEESVKALAQMMKTIARVRRGGQAVEIDAEELVPGRRCAGRGRQPGSRRWSGDPGRDTGDRRGSADRREPAGRQVDRPGARARMCRSATGPAWRT